MGKIKGFKYLFEDKQEYFFLLDFGHSSIKAALLEIDKQSKEAAILDVAEELHPRHLKIAKEPENVSEIAGTIQRAISKLEHPEAKKTTRIVFGLASEMVYGHNFSYNHKRESKNSKIDARELKNVIHTTELKAYEEIRKKFLSESGYPETEVFLLNSSMQDVRIDGYRVANPMGFEGEEILISVFNSYLPIFYKQLLEEVVEILKMDLYDIVYEPYSVFNVLRKNKGDDFESLVIDIGGKTTRVSLVRKGRLEEVKTFSFGGESFTRRIANYFQVGFWEAENIKLRYNDGRLSESAKKKVEKILEREVTVFLGALEMVLKQFSRVNLLPANIYIYGGGGNILLMDAIIRKRKWKRDLSFFNPPKVHWLQHDDFPSIEVKETHISDGQYISILGVADHILQKTTQPETFLSKTLKRMVNLVQT
ncbi:MAG: cell division FtsA domain-containing protein [Candidatus Spechtbacterales bacterium]|nr:cell division FtsA domain-containing protein [Candidatus Spechtbacterales bacterium]